MARYIGTLAALCVTLSASVFAQTATPVGTWQTIDDQTGKPKAIIQITDDGSGHLSGRVVRGIGEFDHPERRCTACTDELKDQLIKGMTIITGMRQDGDSWDGGQILDPAANSTSARCEAGGRQAEARGVRLYRRLAARALPDLVAPAVTRSDRKRQSRPETHVFGRLRFWQARCLPGQAARRSGMTSAEIPATGTSASSILRSAGTRMRDVMST